MTKPFGLEELAARIRTVAQILDHVWDYDFGGSGKSRREMAPTPWPSPAPPPGADHWPLTTDR